MCVAWHAAAARSRCHAVHELLLCAAHSLSSAEQQNIAAQLRTPGAWAAHSPCAALRCWPRRAAAAAAAAEAAAAVSAQELPGGTPSGAASGSAAEGWGPEGDANSGGADPDAAWPPGAAAGSEGTQAAGAAGGSGCGDVWAELVARARAGMQPAAGGAGGSDTDDNSRSAEGQDAPDTPALPDPYPQHSYTPSLSLQPEWSNSVAAPALPAYPAPPGPSYGNHQGQCFVHLAPSSGSSSSVGVAPPSTASPWLEYPTTPLAQPAPVAGAPAATPLMPPPATPLPPPALAAAPPFPPAGPLPAQPPICIAPAADGGVPAGGYGEGFQAGIAAAMAQLHAMRGGAGAGGVPVAAPAMPGLLPTPSTLPAPGTVDWGAVLQAGGNAYAEQAPVETRLPAGLPQLQPPGHCTEAELDGLLALLCST